MLRLCILAGTILGVSACLTACQSLTPIAELSHTSHASQHFGPNRTNYGWNVVSVGVRLRPADGVTIDLLEGYTPNLLDGRHEVFQGRVLWELK